MCWIQSLEQKSCSLWITSFSFATKTQVLPLRSRRSYVLVCNTFCLQKSSKSCFIFGFWHFASICLAWKLDSRRWLGRCHGGLKTPGGLTEELSSIPSTHMTDHNRLWLQFQKSWCPLLVSSGIAHMCAETSKHPYTWGLETVSRWRLQRFLFLILCGVRDHLMSGNHTYIISSPLLFSSPLSKIPWLSIITSALLSQRGGIFSFTCQRFCWNSNTSAPYLFLQILYTFFPEQFLKDFHGYNTLACLLKNYC